MLAWSLCPTACRLRCFRKADAMAGYPGDVQALWDSLGSLMWEFWLELVWSDEVESGSGDFDCNRAVVLCNPDSPHHPPACFIARFPGATSTDGLPMKITGSGRVSETVFTTEPNQYVDEPILCYTFNGVTKLMLAQELQSTGDDQFVAHMRTDIYPVPDVDTHRVEAIEPFVRRGTGIHPGDAELTVAPITSFTQERHTGFARLGKLIPGLNNATSAIPVKVPIIGSLESARWIGLQMFGTNVDCVFRYLGAIIRGRRLT